MSANTTEAMAQNEAGKQGGDTAPGDDLDQNVGAGLLSYCIGLGLATGLTVASFWVLKTHLVWGPSVGVALAALAVAQMGVHLAFFLHITSGPDNTNNILALAFGTLIVILVVSGSLWIMANLNHNMMPSEELMNLHMQH